MSTTGAARLRRFSITDTHSTIRVTGPILLTNPFYELPELATSRVPHADGVAARIDAVTAPLAS